MHIIKKISMARRVAIFVRKEERDLLSLISLGMEFQSMKCSVVLVLKLVLLLLF